MENSRGKPLDRNGYNGRMGRHELSETGQGEAVRRQIVEAADRLIYHRGYNQTSFTDIAEGASVPRGNFYYYFKTKDEILAAVIDARIEAIRMALDKWDQAQADPEKRLRLFLQMIRNSGKNLMRYGCPLGSLNIELGKAQPQLKAKARKMFDLYRDWLAVQLSAMGRQNAQDLAVKLLARAQGVAVMAQVYGDRKLLDEQLAEIEAWILG